MPQTQHRATTCLMVMVLVLSQQCHRTQQVKYVNVALGKPTQQTDDHIEAYSSSLAVDGNRASDYSAGSCTHTASYVNTFWVVDLLRSYRIHSLNITNRNLKPYRLNDFFIYVSRVDPTPIPSHDGNFTGELCLHQTTSIPEHGPHSLKCTSQDILGRYLYVWKPGNEYLTICEFEVIVEKDKNLMDFTIFQGEKSSKLPFLSFTMDVYSKTGCISTCLSSDGGWATLVQMEEATKTCECVEESGLEESAAPDISDVGWILLKSLGNQ